jgi:hypothetical protein
MNTRRTRTAIVLASLALVAAACSRSEPSSGTASPPPQDTIESRSPSPSPVAGIASNPAAVMQGQPYMPDVPRRQNFVSVVDNPYLPWIPGTRWVFEGVSDGQHERNVVEVTDRTKVVMGVATTVVHDQVFSNGELAEDTFDRYAQDSAGNVWYFGEDTAEYEHGEVTSRKGSWEAGVDGALPGIVMLANPEVGERYHQEFLEGEAEDVGKVIALGESLRLPSGSFDRVVVTQDTTPLEPQILEHKFYAPGIGLLMERVLRGGHEISRLVSYAPPA